MATYKEIQGEAIVNSSANVTNEGQVFYNSADKAFKLSAKTSAAAWATGGTVPAGKFVNGGFGTQTANTICAGKPGPVNTTFNYDGSSWTSSGAMGTGRYGLGSGGTQTAGLVYGGYTPNFSNVTEEYDGSSWTSGGNLVQA